MLLVPRPLPAFDDLLPCVERYPLPDQALRGTARTWSPSSSLLRLSGLPTADAASVLSYFCSCSFRPGFYMNSYRWLNFRTTFSYHHSLCSSLGSRPRGTRIPPELGCTPGQRGTRVPAVLRTGGRVIVCRRTPLRIAGRRRRLCPRISSGVCPVFSDWCTHPCPRLFDELLNGLSASSLGPLRGVATSSFFPACLRASAGLPLFPHVRIRPGCPHPRFVIRLSMYCQTPSRYSSLSSSVSCFQ